MARSRTLISPFIPLLNIFNFNLFHHFFKKKELFKQFRQTVPTNWIELHGGSIKLTKLQGEKKSKCRPVTRGASNNNTHTPWGEKSLFNPTLMKRRSIGERRPPCGQEVRTRVHSMAKIFLCQFVSSSSFILITFFFVYSSRFFGGFTFLVFCLIVTFYDAIFCQLNAIKLLTVFMNFNWFNF